MEGVKKWGWDELADTCKLQAQTCCMAEMWLGAGVNHQHVLLQPSPPAPEIQLENKLLIGAELSAVFHDMQLPRLVNIGNHTWSYLYQLFTPATQPWTTEVVGNVRKHNCKFCWWQWILLLFQSRVHPVLGFSVDVATGLFNKPLTIGGGHISFPCYP